MSLFIELDEKKNIFLSSNYTVSKKNSAMEPKGVKLTVDYHIQKIVEEILDERKVNGAVIVADVKTGEIRPWLVGLIFNKKI